MKAKIAVFCVSVLSFSPIQAHVQRYANEGRVQVGNRSANVNQNFNRNTNVNRNVNVNNNVNVNRNVNVHGGLTFGGIEDCVEEDGRGYWFGFDCAHFGDSWINPNVPSDYQWTSEESEEHHYYIYKTRNLAPIRERDFEHYWTHDEVVAETEQLAQQLSKRE